MSYDGTNAAVLSTMDELLKTVYLEPMQEQLNNDNILSALLEVNDRDIDGKNATINCHYGRTTGRGARADGGALPDANYQKFKTATVPMKYNYGRVAFSGPTIAATRTARGSYAKVITSEIEGLVTDVKKETNRQLWGAGYGILCRWATGDGSSSYTVQRKYRGNSVGGDGFGSTFGGKYLKDGAGDMVPVVMTAASSTMTVGTVATTDAAISAVTEGTESTGVDTLTVGTNPSVSEAVGTYFVRPANSRTCTASTAAGYARLEMMGLAGIVDDVDLDDIIYFDGSGNTGFTVADPLQGLAVSTYGWWKAIVDNAAGGKYSAQRTLTFNMIQKMFDKVESAAGKDVGPDLILTTKAIRREYLELCRQDRRSVNTMQLDGGFTGLDYNGVPLTVDDDAIDGKMYFLTTKYLQIFRMSDYEWMQKDGSVLTKVSGYDAYEAILFRYAELGCHRRNTQGVIFDLKYEWGG